MTKPLEGIRVVELADYVSAPVCARILGDMGADVIKIERDAGNAWRETGKGTCPTRFNDIENPGFDINNTGKKMIMLNLKTPEGLEIMHKLLATADVFVTNNRIQALKRLGLDYDSLKEKYPKLIYAIGLGYGEKGPDANTPAFDHTAFWSRTGFLLDMAPITDSYSPVFPPSSVGDNFTGMTLVGEVCAALYNRMKTGKGDYVRSSLFHNGIFAMGAMVIPTQKAAGMSYPRARADLGPVYGDFKCSDGKYIFIAAGYADKNIPKVLTIIGREDLIGTENFATALARKQHAHEIYPILRDAFVTKTSDEWLALGEEYDIPMARMKHFSEVTEDEQALANGYIQEVEYSNGHVDKIPSSPIEMDSVGELHTYPTKSIGQDTEEVLLSLGMSKDELKTLRENSIIN